MKLAVITPVNSYKLSDQGDFYFLLAHVVKQLKSENEEHQQYLNFFDKSKGKNIFLDNGAHENALISGQELFDLANKVNPTHVICPDSLGDAIETKKLTSKFLKLTSSNSQSYNYIGVVQGKTWAEFLWLYNSYLENDKITTIALPYDLELFSLEELSLLPNEKRLMKEHRSYLHMKTRVEILKRLTIKNLLEKDIHFLGWNLPQEMIWLQSYYPTNITISNDSQGYCVYPLNKTHQQAFATLDKVLTPEDFFREFSEEDYLKSQDFIGYVKEKIKGKSAI